VLFPVMKLRWMTVITDTMATMVVLGILLTLTQMVTLPLVNLVLPQFPETLFLWVLLEDYDFLQILTGLFSLEAPFL